MKSREKKRRNELASPKMRIRLCKKEAAPFLASRSVRVTLFSVLVLLLLSSLGLSVFLTGVIRFLLRVPLLSRPFTVIPTSIFSIALSECLTMLFVFPLFLGANGYLHALTHGDCAPEFLLFMFYTDKDLRLFSVVLYLRMLFSVALFGSATYLTARYAVLLADRLSVARATLVLFLALIFSCLLLAFLLLDLLSLFPAVGEAVRAPSDAFRHIFARARRRMQGNRLLLLRLYLSYGLRFLLILLSGGLLLPWLMPRILMATSLFLTSCKGDTEDMQVAYTALDNSQM